MLKSSYIYVYKNPGAKLPEASEFFLSELIYFHWKSFILETFYILPQANQGGGQDFIKGPDPGPMLATSLQPCRSVIFSNLIVPAGRGVACGRAR